MCELFEISFKSGSEFCACVVTFRGAETGKDVQDEKTEVVVKVPSQEPAVEVGKGSEQVTNQNA